VLWSPNLQLHYPFENQPNDYSGNARHGTVFGTGAYATKPNGGRCLYFDGVGDYVATPSFGLSGTVVVFAAHVRCKQVAGNQELLGDASSSATIGFLLCRRTNNTNHLYWYYANGVAAANDGFSVDYFAAPYNDTWLHMAIVCDYSGKNIYFFRNAILYSTKAMSGAPVFPTANRVKYLGTYNGIHDLLQQGYLQDVYLATLASMPAAGHMLANANRLMLGLNPIW